MIKRVRLTEVVVLREQPNPEDLLACARRIADPILYFKSEWYGIEHDFDIIDLDILTQVMLFNRTYWVRSPAWSFVHKLVKNGR
jgi:hypothetical protein